MNGQSKVMSQKNSVEPQPDFFDDLESHLVACDVEVESSNVDEEPVVEQHKDLLAELKSALGVETFIVFEVVESSLIEQIEAENERPQSRKRTHGDLISRKVPEGGVPKRRRIEAVIVKDIEYPPWPLRRPARELTAAKHSFGGNI